MRLLLLLHRNMRRGFAALLCATTMGLANAQTPASAGPALLMEGNARVVLVGDSITGQSRNNPAGYAHQMDWALRQTYPGCTPRIVALGGSGQGVQSWLSVEKRSRTESVFLDVKGIDVKAELDQPANVLIIMLGMNDVLAPYVRDEPASWEQWTGAYRELITALRSRLKPKYTALATATLCTEDTASPKNRVMDELNAHVAALAEEMGLLAMPLRTNETMKEILQLGRRVQPGFHVTGDFVHPNEAGHLAIAIGMLRGFCEDRAAQILREQRVAKLLDKAAGELPALSYEIDALPPEPAAERQSFRVRYWVTQSGTVAPTRVTLAGEGWAAVPPSLDKAEGEFVVTGVPDHRENFLKLTAQIGDRTVEREVRIPTPWLVAAGVIRKAWNERQLLDLPAVHDPMKAGLEAGAPVAAPGDFAQGQPLAWQRYFPSVNFTGGNAPGSVDFAAVTHARPFEAGYAARWIHSDRERPVTVELSTQEFAGTLQMALYLNGKKLYDGLLTGEPQRRKSIEARLRPGWNALDFNLNHITWQWQCSVDLKPVGDDSLEDLRYSALPHEAMP